MKQHMIGLFTTSHADHVVSEFLSILSKELSIEGYDLSVPFGGNHPDRMEIPDVVRFRDEYLFSNIMRKFSTPQINGVELHARAIEDVLAAEALCSQHSSRFSRGSFETNSLSLDAVMFTAAAHCCAVLGDFSWDEVYDHCDFGPGASTTHPRRFGDRYYKIGNTSDVSTGCVSLLEDYLSSRRPLWKRVLLERNGVAYSICDFNRISTVPKDFTKDRPIAIEPGWNMFFQKGIGAVMRSRLRRRGVNLNDQSLNQRLAREGSSAGTWCTIDLSSASDTVSWALVNELIPPEWLNALEITRSTSGKLGEWYIRYHKFSSMGNGFTFELETLVFLSICYAVDSLLFPRAKGRRVMVYGDDILCHRRSYEAIIEVLERCGFVPNAQKSFGSGPFRESCGKHWAHGHDVSPFFIRRPLSRPDGSVVKEEVFLLYNNLTRWSTLRYAGARDMRVRPALEFLRGLLPDRWKKPSLFDGFGDGALIGSFDEVTPRTFWDPDLQKRLYELSCLVPFRFKQRNPKDMVRFLKALHLSELKKLGEGTAFDGRLGVTRKSILVDSAPNLGPFINFLNGETL